MSKNRFPFTDAPRLSQVKDLNELALGKYTKRDKSKAGKYAKNKTIQCECKKFELKKDLSTGHRMEDRLEYCICGHVRKKHINGKNHCFAKWIEKNEDRKTM